MKSVVVLPFLNELANNLARTPQFLQVLLGPRQVGKTTSIEHFIKHMHKGPAHFVSADTIFNSDANWLRENWQKAREQKALLVIDEIQKVENWPEVVKKFWDEEKKSASPIKCVLLGSSSLDIQRGLSESLTGRFQLIRAYHWNFRESSQGYGLDFEEFLRVGGYPGSYELAMNATSWKTYLQKSIVETVIEKDILLNHTVKSPALFRQTFEILMSYPAQEISYTKLLGQIQDRGNVELVKHYIRLYEGAFLLKTLEKFSTNKIKTRSSSPKVLPLCPAFYYLNILADYEASERGRVFEALVGSQLVRTGNELYYWREGQMEVDYVLKRGKRIWAIEVKSGTTKKASSLEAFKEKFKNSVAVIINPENYQNFERDPMAFLEKL